MNKISRHLLCVFCILILGSIQSWGQTYPVDGMVNAIPPNSPYLSDYSTPSPDRLQMILNLLDENEPSIEVALQLTIEGNGILLQSDPNVVLPTFTLMPGPNVLSGHDVRDFLDPANMLISGIEKNSLLQGDALPEGMYNICIDVVDNLRKDKHLMRQACAMLVVHLNNPPDIVHPTCDGIASYNEQQNIPIQWHSNHDPAIQATYHLTMVHVPKGMDPNQAILASQTPLLDKVMTSMTTFQYGPDFPELDYGEQYAIRVDVEDAMGNTTFENEGIGVVCAFTYASDSLGNIALNEPEDEGVFNPASMPIFSWNGPSNVKKGDPVHYKLIVTQIGNNQSAQEAMDRNLPIHTQETEIVSQLVNWNTALTAELDRETPYAWKVEAYIHDDKIASSPARSFHTSALIDHFIAANKRVRILSTDNDDFSKLSGKGQIQLEKEGEWIPITFKDIHVEHFEGTNILRSGLIESEITDGYEIDIELGKEGEAEFRASHIVLNSENLKLRGVVEWTLPLASLNSNGPPKVMSKVHEIIYDTYALEGHVELQENNFQLVDPHGFELVLANSSKLYIGLNKNKLELDGHVRLPQAHVSDDEQPISIAFSDVASSKYFTVKNTEGFSSIKVDDEMNIHIAPSDVIFDFDIEQSPEKKSTHKAWMGMYMNEFIYRLGTIEDSTHQLKFPDDMSATVLTNLNPHFKGWVGDEGLDISFDVSNFSLPLVSFNTFIGSLSHAMLKIENSVVQSGHFKGAIYSQFIGDKPLPFTVNVHSDGLATGHLDESLNGMKVAIANADSKDPLTVTIRNAVFKNNVLLDMSVDMHWANNPVFRDGVESKINIPDFHVYGNGDIGVGGRNGFMPLQDMYTSVIDESFTMHFDSIGASLVNGRYVVATVGEMPMGNDFSAQSGDPVRSTVFTVGNAYTTDYPSPEQWLKVVTGVTDWTSQAFTDAGDFIDDVFKFEINQTNKKENNFTNTKFKVVDDSEFEGNNVYPVPLSLNRFGIPIGLKRVGVIRDELFGFGFVFEAEFNGETVIPGFDMKGAISVIIGGKTMPDDPKQTFQYAYVDAIIGTMDVDEVLTDKRLSKYYVKANTFTPQVPNVHRSNFPVLGGLRARFFINMKRNQNEKSDYAALPSFGHYGGGGLLGVGLNALGTDDLVSGIAGGDLILYNGQISQVDAYLRVSVHKDNVISAKGGLQFFLDMEEYFFKITGDAQVFYPVCGAVDFDVNYNWETEALEIRIAEEDDPAFLIFYPPGNGCTGVGAIVYFHYLDQHIDVGAGVRFMFRATSGAVKVFSFGEIRAQIDLNFDIMAKASVDWKDKFEIQKLGVKLSAGAKLTLHWISFTGKGTTVPLVYAYVSGEGDFLFYQDRIDFGAELKAHADILGVGVDIAWSAQYELGSNIFNQ